MRIVMKGTTGHLHGDLTDSGANGSCIDSLSDSLQQIEAGGSKNVRIDCAKILRADLGGLRVLYVWMQCARFRGVELELVNLSESLMQHMHSLGIRKNCFLPQAV